jgi:hypothetical protein
MPIRKMKVNLNNYMLDSQNYLIHLYDNNHIDHCDYDKYINVEGKNWNHIYADLIRICDDNNIDIYPYLYTLDRINDNEKNAFDKFYNIYMRKTEMIDKYNYDSAIEIAKQSLENLLTFIITIQYFFL